MEANVKLWQLIVACIGLAIAVGTMVYNTGGRDVEQNVRLDYQQKQINEIVVNATIDRKESKERDERIIDVLQDIQLSLKDKEDRKR